MTNTANFGSTGSTGVLNIARNLTQVWRLLWDPKVPTALKMFLPVAALVYWISPIDLIPLVPIDDIAVLIAAFSMFAYLAPAMSRSDETGAGTGIEDDADEIIDTTWSVIED